MKRYIVTSQNRISFDNLDNAIDCAKRFARNNDCSIYVSEIVGAVHPGKPRWRPTERKERVEKPNGHPPIFSDDEPLDYKITVRTCAIGRRAHLVGALVMLTNLSKTAAEFIAESGGAFLMRGLTASQFNNAKSHLESAGATIEYEIL